MITLPELQWLGRIIRGGETTDCLTWCEDRLWKKDLIVKFRYEWKYSHCLTYRPTTLGMEVYEMARKRWMERERVQQ